VSGLAPLIALLLLVAVAIFVSAPVRELLFDGKSGGSGRSEDRLAAMEAERAARLRELADAELDYRTGKLDKEVFEQLRDRIGREALALADAIEAAKLADLQEGDRVGEEEDREDDGPTVEVTLNHRPAAKGPAAGADAEGA